MDKTKQTLAIALVAVLAVVAGGWFLLVSPQRSDVASLNQQTTSQEQTNASLQGKITALKAELVQLPEAKAQLEAVARRLPPDLAEVSLIQALTKAANDANVDLQVITPGAPTQVAVAAATAALPTATTTGGTGTTGAAAAPAAPAASAGNLYSVPLSMTVAGDYFDLEMFIHNLEGMQRAVLVSNLAFAKTNLTITDTSSASPQASGSAVTPVATVTSASAVKSTTSKGKTTGKTTTSKAGKTSKAAKPLPGSVAAAQQAAGNIPAFVVDDNTLTVAITASVFSLYSTTPAAAAVPTAAVTSAPTK